MSATRSTVPTLAVLCDFPEENWPSMDLMAEMLLAEAYKHHASEITATRTVPKFRRVFGPWSHNADRLLNRTITYPRAARRIRDQYDLFHICDHSYGQLVHSLPAERTGVFCHDLDTFGCVLEPHLHPRPRWFRAIVRRTLSGLQKAAVVFHTTAEIRRQILGFGLVDETRLINAPGGVAPEFVAHPPQIDALPRNFFERTPREFVLHVGSCIPRKRIDILLHAFARLRARRPDLRLVKAGAEWSAADRALIEALGLADAVVHLSTQPRSAIAELYRRARIVLMTSDAEGFGLPVVEALACGAIVVASDIPTMREAGGDAALYATPGNVDSFVANCEAALEDGNFAPSAEKRLAHAARFTWAEHARIIVQAYLRLAR
ncbi:MAG: glycosyltransferase family 4 protein [Anaerolineae bacterium]|nr:glycosyltransferase family 4 protein [Phycisphaerae bacterium]